MLNLLYYLVPIALLISLVEHFFGPILEFRKEFGKWPRQISDDEVRNKLNELSSKWMVAKEKCHGFAQDNLDREYLETQCYCAEYTFKKVLSVIKRMNRTPHFGDFHSA